MKKYLVVIRDCYVRDAQVAPDEYIDAIETDSYDRLTNTFGMEWNSIDSELVIGVFEGEYVDNALNVAAESFNIDKRGLKAYQLM